MALWGEALIGDAQVPMAGSEMESFLWRPPYHTAGAATWCLMALPVSFSASPAASHFLVLQRCCPNH